MPLVDWGARFEAIRLPARLRVDLRTVDRQTVQRVAQAGTLDVQNVRGQARDAIAGYLKALIGVTMLARALARAAGGVRDPRRHRAAAALDGRRSCS